MTPVFDLIVAPQLWLPLKSFATGYPRSQEAPMPDSLVTWQILGVAWAAATNPTSSWLPLVVSHVAVSSNNLATDITVLAEPRHPPIPGAIGHPQYIYIYIYIYIIYIYNQGLESLHMIEHSPMIHWEGIYLNK